MKRFKTETIKVMLRLIIVLRKESLSASMSMRNYTVFLISKGHSKQQHCLTIHYAGFYKSGLLWYSRQMYFPKNFLEVGMLVPVAASL